MSVIERDLYRQEVIDPGDRASRLAKEICFKSHGNSQAVTVIAHQPGNFRGPVGYIWKKHILQRMIDSEDNPEKWVMTEEMENDGAGGKPQFFTYIGTPDTFFGLGWEIITMTADDFARSGRFPAVIANEMNVKNLTERNFPLFQSTMEGYGEALCKSRLVNITGEFAVMKHSITSFCDNGEDNQLVLTWGATCIGLAHKKLLIDNSRVRPGMAIIGFREMGYRCNGGTFFTNVFLETWGKQFLVSHETNGEMKRFMKMLTVPSQSYARFITDLIGWLPDGDISTPLTDIYGIAHITGGGVWGKFGEILPKGVGANLDSMPKPAEILLWGQELSWNSDYRLTDWQAYSTLHGGCGMFLICDDKDSIRIVDKAGEYGIDAHYVGETTASPDNEILIQSRFKEGKELSSLRKE